MKLFAHYINMPYYFIISWIRRFLLLNSIVIIHLAVSAQSFSVKCIAQNVTDKSRAFILSSIPADTVSFIGGQVSFRGNILEGEVASLWIDYKGSGDFLNYYHFYLSPGDILLNIQDLSGMDICDVSGNPYAVEFEYKLARPVVDFNNQAKRVGAKLREARLNNIADTIEISKTLNELVRNCFLVPQRYIESNPKSPLSLIALKMMESGGPGTGVNKNRLEELYYSIAEEIRNTKQGKDYKTFLDKLR